MLRDPYQGKTYRVFDFCCYNQVIKYIRDGQTSALLPIHMINLLVVDYSEQQNRQKYNALVKIQERVFLACLRLSPFFNKKSIFKSRI